MIAGANERTPRRTASLIDDGSDSGVVSEPVWFDNSSSMFKPDADDASLVGVVSVCWMFVFVGSSNDGVVSTETVSLSPIGIGIGIGASGD